MTMKISLRVRGIYRKWRAGMKVYFLLGRGGGEASPYLDKHRHNNEDFFTRTSFTRFKTTLFRTDSEQVLFGLE